MHVFDKSTAVGTADGVLEVTRWEQFQATSSLPFGAMWYSVAPASSSPVDQHPDAELSIVLVGDAEVETGGVVTKVCQGSAFLLDGGEAHVVHNRSADTPLQILSAYWIPGAERGAAEAGGTGDD